MDNAHKRAGVAAILDESAESAGLRAAAEAATGPGRDAVKTILVFAAGRHAASTLEVAVGASEAVPGATVVVLGGAGFATAAGEEGRTGVVALALDAPSVVATGAAPDTMEAADAVGREMASVLRQARARPMLFFGLPSGALGRSLATFADHAGAQAILGGGLSPSGNAAVRVPGEAPRDAGALVALRIDGGYRLAIGATAGVAPLGDFHVIGAMDGGFVTDLDGEPPLDVLAGVAQSRSLVLALVERSAGVPEDARLRFAVRGIGGVDPRKKAIYVGDDVSVGDRLAFATPDAKAAREDFGAMLRDVTRHLSGGAPIAALYADCAGRGARLYKRHHVDARALGNHFPGLPFTCLRSSFEIGSHLGRPEVHTYTGVLGILYAPS